LAAIFVRHKARLALLHSNFLIPLPQSTGALGAEAVAQPKDSMDGPQDPTADATGAEPDLTICDRELITRLDRIQSFGFLVALSNDWTVVRASENLKAFLGVSVEQTLGQRFDSLISDQATHDIRNRMAMLFSTGAERLYGVKLLEGRQQAFDLCLHLTSDLLIIEGEESQPDGGMEAASMVRSMIARLAQADTLEAFHRSAARQVRAITGFDRVMIYRFDETGAGEVIADSTRSGVDSFLGLHFPASDIPVQARALYLRNAFRIIADVTSAPTPLLPPIGGVVQPLDLTMAITRAVSPVHIEYLRNMGVGASLSISIIVDGKLWGLIACHNETPRLPSFVMRTAAELFGQMYSLTLESRVHQAASEEAQRVDLLSERLLSSIASDPSLLKDAQWLQDVSRDMIASDGVAIYHSGEIFTSGAVPPDNDVRALAQKLALASPSRVFDTDCLASVYSDSAASADRAAGMLAIPLSRISRDYIMLFRREWIQEIKWGGDPAKAVEQANDSARLSPRKSFAAFASMTRGRSRPFTPQDRRIGEAIRQAMIEVSLRFSESTGDAQKQAVQRQELLIAELNHRVRNILSLIRGLITQSERSASELASYVGALNGRVQALARAHDKITKQNWGPAPLMSLFVDEMAAQSGDDPDRLVLNGPAVLLTPRAVSTMALVIHELITNSIKYGALSTVGTIHVSAEPGSDGLWLRWRERGGPTVQPPERSGFGSVIVERTVVFDLQGKTEIRFAPAGFEADFFIPHDHIASVSEHDSAPQAREESVSKPPLLADKPLEGVTVLLVEDNLLIALEAEEMLTDLGARLVVSASTLRAAEDAILTHAFGFAMLDINVGRGTSFDLARRLRSTGTPLIFASGYGDQATLDSDHSASIIVQKPFERDHLRRAIQLAIRDRAAAV
jgi:light-regulated signal transduction histidine kinase (bacteriophytochrome)/CheY-like chemotaxis protein